MLWLFMLVVRMLWLVQVGQNALLAKYESCFPKQHREDCSELLQQRPTESPTFNSKWGWVLLTYVLPSLVERGCNDTMAVLAQADCSCNVASTHRGLCRITSHTHEDRCARRCCRGCCGASNSGCKRCASQRWRPDLVSILVVAASWLLLPWLTLFVTLLQ